MTQASPELTYPSFVETIDPIIHDYDTLIVDLWGVIHDGYTPLPGVVQTLGVLQEMGKQVVFLTNAPRRAASVEAQLGSLGVKRSLYHSVYSSGENAHETLSSQSSLGPAYLMIDSANHQCLFYDLDLHVVDHCDKAAFILNTGPSPLNIHDHQEDLEKAAERGIPMICVNPDIQVISGGKVKLCAGALAQAYENLGGAVSYHGKPYPAVYQALLKKLDLRDTKRVLAIGDSLSTDILGANTMGLDSLLVLSGIEDGGHFNGLWTPTTPLFCRMKSKNIFPNHVAPGLKISGN